VITDFLAASAQHQRWYADREALDALAAFGSAAAGSLQVILPLAKMPDLRPPAAVPFWSG
jgi:hypothetical protein